MSKVLPACPVAPPDLIALPPKSPEWCQAASASTVAASDRQASTSASITGRPGPVMKRVGAIPFTEFVQLGLAAL